MLSVAFFAVILNHAAGIEWNVQVDPFGPDAARVRIGPKIVDPKLQALLPDGPEVAAGYYAAKPESLLFQRFSEESALPSIDVGNLRITTSQGASGEPLVTATRLSDGKTLLQQTALVAGAPDGYTNPSDGAFSARVSFEGHGNNERIYGMGEQRTGTVQRLPYFGRFEDSEDYAISHGGQQTIPVILSSEGYAFLWNMPSYGFANLTAEGLTWYSNGTIMVDFWIATTPATPGNSGLPSPYGELLHRYSLATGRPPVLPGYATGFIQCKNRYRNQTQLLDVARGYFERKLPVSLIVIDWNHWPALGDWRFNDECWPDPQGMVDELHTMGIELMVSVWPLVANPSDSFNKFDANGFLVQNSSTDKSMVFDLGNYVYDPSSAEARASVFSKMKEGYLRYGIKTYWLDASEPEHKGEKTAADAYMPGVGTPMAESGEAWVLEHHRMVAEGLNESGVALGDFMALSRSTWAGSQRYGMTTWSGDIVSTFEELALQVTVGQGIATSGFPYWTTDTGGFRNSPPNTDPTMQQLIVRWMQFSLFSPLMRLHGTRQGGPPSNACGFTNGPNEVWTYGKEIEPILGGLIVLRNSLGEYIRDLSKTASEAGMPMMRPMALQFPDDPKASDPTAAMESQFMFGPDWVVAPVLYKDAANRTLYLPALPQGQEWAYLYNASVSFQGGQDVTLVTPLDEFPALYRRDSSAVPGSAEHGPSFGKARFGP